MDAEANRNETVYVVDDDASIRKALARVFRIAGMAVETFESADTFLANGRPSSPGCLVLDLQMPEVDGLELQTKLAATEVAIPVVFISGHANVASSVRAMKGGAVDFIEKPFSEGVLLSAVRDALERSRSRFAADTERHAAHALAKGLTPREREVLDHVARGQPNKVIAANLGISEKTVKVHRGRVMEKMRARSLADLVRLAGHLSFREH